MFVEAREIQMQLQGLPQADCGFLRIAGANQQVQRSAVSLQQVGGDMRADVSGGTGQEYRHVASVGVPGLPTVAPFSGSASCRLRAGTRFQRASFNQRISPLAQRRNVNIDPVIPPVDRLRVVSECCLLFCASA